MSVPEGSVPSEGTPPPASPELPAAPAVDRAAILAELDAVHSDLADQLAVFTHVPFESCTQVLVDEFTDTIGELNKRARTVIASATPFAKDDEFSGAFTAVRKLAPQFEGFLMRLRVRNDTLTQSAAVPSAPTPEPVDRPTPVYLVTDDEIPKFSGDSKAWRSWWNLYNNAIHKNDYVSLTQKFKTLTKSLTGEARALIGQPSWDLASYNSAIAKLQDEYAPSRGAAKRLFNAIKEVTPPRNNGEDLRDFVTRFRTAITEYEDTAASVLPDMTICQLLDDLVPGEVRTALYLRTHSYEITAEQYYAELRGISEVHVVSNNVKTYSQTEVRSHQETPAPQASTVITARQAPPPQGFIPRANPYPSGNPSGHNGRFYHNPRRNDSNPVAPVQQTARSAPMAPVNRAQPPQQRAPPAQTAALPPLPPREPIRGRNYNSSCRFCNGNHYPSSCHVYPSAAARVGRLREQGRCINCFLRPHPGTDCVLNGPCNTCQGLHKYPVCPSAQFRIQSPPVNVSQAVLPNPYDTYATHQDGTIDPNTYYTNEPVSADQATGQLIDNYHSQAQQYPK